MSIGYTLDPRQSRTVPTPERPSVGEELSLPNTVRWPRPLQGVSARMVVRLGPRQGPCGSPWRELWHGD